MNQDSDYLYMAWARESLVASNGDQEQQDNG